MTDAAAHSAEERADRRERRKQPRRGTLWHGTLRTPAGVIGCRVLNLSARGAKLEIDGTVAPGSIDGRTQCFVAWGLQRGAPHPEPEEELVQRRVPFAESISMALSGEISHFASISLLLGIQTKLARGELPAELMKLLAD